MTTTSPLAPLVAYYGCLIDSRKDEFVASHFEAEQIIPELVRTVPVTAVRAGDFQGDYVVMVPIPWALPRSFGDDEYDFEMDF